MEMHQKWPCCFRQEEDQRRVESQALTRVVMLKQMPQVHLDKMQDKKEIQWNGMEHAKKKKLKINRETLRKILVLFMECEHVSGRSRRNVNPAFVSAFIFTLREKSRTK